MWKRFLQKESLTLLYLGLWKFFFPRDRDRLVVTLDQARIHNALVLGARGPFKMFMAERKPPMFVVDRVLEFLVGCGGYWS